MVSVLGVVWLVAGLVSVSPHPVRFVDTETGLDLGNAYYISNETRSELLAFYDGAAELLHEFDVMVAEKIRQDECRKSLPLRRKRFPKGNERDRQTHLDCLACFQGNHTDRVFLLRGTPVLTQCASRADFPRRSLGGYYAFHLVCSQDFCDYPYVPISFRADDIDCGEGGKSLTLILIFFFFSYFKPV